MCNKKPAFDDYAAWLRKEHRLEITDRERTYYSSVTDRIRSAFEKSDLWTELTENLREYDDEYLMRTGYRLLVTAKPTVDVKTFDSFFLKTYRKNVLDNGNWPDEPSGGWILPTNWYSKINDIVRTLLVVKYLDGVEFMVEKIRSVCEQRGAECNVSLEARGAGYYAAHTYSTQEFEVPKRTWDTERIHVSVEIQITTEMQELIRRLLHKYYDARRKQIKEEDLKWQWDYQSEEFAANYLGHILHYVEGMIMEIREKQKEEKR